MSKTDSVFCCAKTIEDTRSFEDTVRITDQDSIIIVRYFQDGYKYKAQSINSFSLVMREALFNRNERIQNIEYNQSGQVMKFSQQNDSFYIYMNLPDSSTTGSVDIGKDGEGSCVSFNFRNNCMLNDLAKKVWSGGNEFEGYHKNGQLMYKFIASNEPSPYSRYFSNGQIAEKGTILFTDHTRLSDWEEWNETGDLIRTYSYHESVPNQREGNWKWFNEKREVVKWEVYSEGILIQVKVEESNKR